MADDTLDWLADTQRLLEERLIEDEGGMRPSLHILCGGDLVLAMISSTPWALVPLAPAAVSGFAADEIVFATDTWMSRRKTNPEGRRWEVGEMSQRAHEPAVRALLSEAVIVVRARRNQRVESARALYERQGGRVVWGKRERADGVSGRIVAALAEAVQAPYVLDVMRVAHGVGPGDFGLSDREAEVHRHMACIRALAGMSRRDGTEVGFGYPASEEPWAVAIVKESLRRAGLDPTVVDLGERRRREWWHHGGQ
jgi:hypothetical protein